ncbi:small multidrug efflux protein [Brevibacterium sp. GP-SGM9]|uniref:small multidrug efflux protein n=1 Tax=Brevibacterium sp. GP-SGM9 TaxID=3376990 RepID=UPI0039A71E43
MNGIIEFFQGLASHVPDLLQPVIIAMAGAVPFVEGEISSVIGVWAGLNPVIAGLAGAIGNFICVTVIVLLGARARKAVVARRDEKRTSSAEAAVPATMAAGSSADAELHTAGTGPHHLGGVDLDRTDHLGEADLDAQPRRDGKPESKGRVKFKRFLTRFGVPGASLLGPLAIPTQITSTILVSAGVKTSWILLWQGIAIAAWTTLTTLIATGALAFFAG